MLYTIDQMEIEDALYITPEKPDIQREVATGLVEIMNDKTLSEEEFRKKARILFDGRKKIAYFDDNILTITGNLLMEEKEYERGNILLELALTRAVKGEYMNEITLFLRLAEYQYIMGHEEKGTEYLIRLCEGETSNYVEAIHFRGLDETWNRYRHYVDGKVRESQAVVSSYRKEPSECSTPISEIIQMKDMNELLTALSIHVNEICGDGEYLNCLNQWERNFFYVDQLWSCVNGDGMDAYLCNEGQNFERVRKTAEKLEIQELVILLNKVEERFPKNRVPKNPDRIAGIIDERKLDFEDLDDLFYDRFDSIIADALYGYFERNKKKFR